MSDRFKIIDHATFEQMQKSNSKASASSNGARIRNAKYRRMTTNGFDLMQFMKNRHDTAKDNRKIVRNRRVLHFTPRFNKKKGKQSENGRKRHKSRLKKTILRNRQMKSKSHQEELQLANQIQAITLNQDEPFGKGETKTMKREATLHSSRFRSYCDNCSTPALKEYTETLLRELNRFQRRAYAQNQIKARAHRRLILGFREVQNFLRINKVKLVIIATDCERCEGEAGIDETISDIKMLCQDQQVPVAFPCQRRQLSYFLYKKASVSCVGVLDIDGVRDTFQKLIFALKEAKDIYKIRQESINML